MTDFAATVPADVLLKEGMCDRGHGLWHPSQKVLRFTFLARLLQSVCDATLLDCVEAGNTPEKWKVKLAALLGGSASACAILMSHVCLETTTCTCEEFMENFNDVFSNEAQKRWGSKYIQEKTKVLGNQNSSRRKEMEIDNIKVDILTNGESTKNLGQIVTFQQQETTEIKNRIRPAWATFYKYKQELTSK